MTMYLLLRNNKQSGPYSLDDLKNMGLKAYDLVWLEGKSAAWRYPSEIEELKEFAPAVEEQPFDRFYKKPAAAAVSASNGNQDTTTISFRPATEVSAPGDKSVTTHKRIIYVTLPSGKPAPQPMREAPVREIERPRQLIPEPVTPVSATPATGDYPSLSDHRDRTPVEFAPRHRSHQKERLFRVAGIGGSILALLAAGIFIGLSLNKESLGLQRRIASRTTPQSVAKQTNPQPTVIPAANAAIPANTTEKTTAPVGDNTISSTVSAVRRVRKQKEKIPAALMPPVQKDSVLADIPVVTREAVHRTQAEPSIDSKEAAKTAISSEVSVGANRYSVGTFGGINDLQLTVSNRSAYPLDLVVVEVQYIQANKKVYKTENLSFRGISPGAALMQEAPKSSRGIRVQYKITSISSKELGLSYSGL